MVDARQHQVARLVEQQVVEGHLYAIDGCAGEGVDGEPLLLVAFVEEERLVHGDRLAHAALRNLGGYDNDTPIAACDGDGGLQTFGGVTVVVGDEY